MLYVEDKERLVKIKGETAIPTGKNCYCNDVPKFQKRTTFNFEQNFNFTVCGFHGGNNENDSEGCPLLGMVRHSNAISNCAPAVALVTKMIKEAKEAQLTLSDSGNG